MVFRTASLWLAHDQSEPEARGAEDHEATIESVMAERARIHAGQFTWRSRSPQ